MIQKTGLVFFDGFRSSELENFFGSGIFQGEDSSDHFIGVFKFSLREVVLVPEMRENVTSYVYQRSNL